MCKQSGEAYQKLNPEEFQLLWKVVWYLRQIVLPEGIITGPKKL
jgi:hypothetical protein